MPASSKSQYRLMQAIAHGFHPTNKPVHMSEEQAKEYVKGNVGKKAYSKLRERVLRKKKETK